MAQQSKGLSQEHEIQSSEPQNPLKCQVCVIAYERPAVAFTSEGETGSPGLAALGFAQETSSVNEVEEWFRAIGS